MPVTRLPLTALLLVRVLPFIRSDLLFSVGRPTEKIRSLYSFRSQCRE